MSVLCIRYVELVKLDEEMLIIYAEIQGMFKRKSGQSGTTTAEKPVDQ